MTIHKFDNFLRDNSSNLNALCVLLGILMSFFLFFIRPVFLNPDHVMKFLMYVPIVNPIGLDLNYMLDYCASWFINHNTPYIGLNLYPPLAMILFRPLLLLDRSSSFEVITIINFLAYVFTALIIPILISTSKKDTSIVMLFFLTGLFSYGFHFEIEKGQFNLIAFLFCSLGVYLFHNNPSKRYLAYILLTISIQLKVYPAIFVLMMIDNWADWKVNLKRIFGLVVFNFLLLFAGGYYVFLDFIEALQKQMINPNLAITNHSIKVFSELLFRKIGLQEYFVSAGVSQNHLKMLISHYWVVEIVLMGVVALCLLLILIKAHRLNLLGLNVYTFLACTICALVIPAVSNDYKLPLLIGPLALIMRKPMQIADNISRMVIFTAMKFVASFAYTTTLFSYTNKPLFLQNNLPALLIILLAITVMIILERPVENV